MVAPLQHARERIDVIREPIQPDGLAPIKVLQRRPDLRFIVFYPSLPLGRMTASHHATIEDATEAAKARKAGR